MLSRHALERQPRAGRLFARGLLLLAAAALAAPAPAADVYDLLRRSVTADRRFSYQGTKILTQWVDGQEQTTRAKVYHLAPDRTLLRAVDGDRAGAAVLQAGRQHFYRPPGGIWQRLPLPPPVDNTEDLLRNYRLRQMRVEPIAGRRCVMLSIEPRYAGNPRKLVWLDLKTALPLKTVVFDSTGRPTDESYFLTLDYHPRLPASMFYVPGRAYLEEYPEVRPDFRVLSVPRSGLPPGYRLVETSVRRLPGGHIVSFQRFSDGLNTLTLLQSRTHPDLTALDRGNARVRGQVGSVRYVLCGDQEPATLRRMAASLGGTPMTIR